MPDWPRLERDLHSLPRPALALWANRAARRAAPLIGRAEAAFGPEAWEWCAAVHDALDAAPAASPFALRVAAQLPRTVADAASLAARRLGPSPLTEPLELACAAAAYALDAAGAADPRRAASLGAQAGQMAEATGLPVMRLMEQDAAELRVGVEPGDLWPLGPPDGWDEWQAELARRRAGLARFLAPPSQ